MKYCISKGLRVQNLCLSQSVLLVGTVREGATAANPIESNAPIRLRAGRQIKFVAVHVRDCIQLFELIARTIARVYYERALAPLLGATSLQNTYCCEVDTHHSKFCFSVLL